MWPQPQLIQKRSQRLRFIWSTLSKALAVAGIVFAATLNSTAFYMNNYLVYPDCVTDERINGCRFALLKTLSVYNLTPPANMGVIVYTNKPAQFEIFLSFFKHMQVIELQSPARKEATPLAGMSQAYEGNLLFCQTHCYLKAPVEPLFHQLINEDNSSHPADSSCVLNIKAQATTQHASASSTADYFINYEDVKEMAPLLKTFFSRNEEESLPNLVKKAHAIDANAIRKEVAGARNAPLLQKWWNNLLGRNPVLQRYQKKL